MSDHKQDDSFRVIDRRPFTSEGELRKDVVEEQEREAKVAATKASPAPAEKAKAPANPPPADAPKRVAAFENLVRTRDALKRYVEQQMRPGDLVAIVRTGGA